MPIWASLAGLRDGVALCAAALRVASDTSLIVVRGPVTLGACAATHTPTRCANADDNGRHELLGTEQEQVELLRTIELALASGTGDEGRVRGRALAGAAQGRMLEWVLRQSTIVWLCSRMNWAG